MIKMIAAVCRRPGMTHAECLSYIYRVHAALARQETSTLRRYVQNHVFDSAYGVHGDRTHTMLVNRDSVTELYWDDFDGMRANFAHPFTREKIGPDGANFADLANNLSMIATEVELRVVSPSHANAKVMHFLRKLPSLSLEEYFVRWTRAHERVLAEDPVVAATLRGAVQNRQVTEGNEMLQYFGGKDIVIPEGVASLWYDDESTIGSFRRYEQALLRINAEPDNAFYLPSASFFLYASGREIL